MKVLITGGSGFLGTALQKSLIKDNHEVFILTRQPTQHQNEIRWDGKTATGWGHRINEMDAVVNLTGFGLEHWPWTKCQKKRFVNSLVQPGQAFTSAIQSASHRPGVFLQTSGINRYGLRGVSLADESTPAGEDFLAQLTVVWEDATRPVEDVGVRRVIFRNAAVLDRRDGLFPLMALTPRLFFGGTFGGGKRFASSLLVPYSDILAAADIRRNERALNRRMIFAAQTFVRIRLPVSIRQTGRCDGRFAQPKITKPVWQVARLKLDS